MIELNTNELKEKAKTLRAGDKVLLSGTVYTSRDAAHKRIKQLIEEQKQLPYELSGAAIYYAGPTAARDGMVIGSCGPTTSGRMDVYSPMMLDMGLSAMIGKGERSEAVCEAVRRNGAVYFCAIGGAGALALHLARLRDGTAVEQELLRQCSFTGVRMGNDGKCPTSGYFFL